MGGDVEKKEIVWTSKIRSSFQYRGRKGVVLTVRKGVVLTFREGESS